MLCKNAFAFDSEPVNFFGTSPACLQRLRGRRAGHVRCSLQGHRSGLQGDWWINGLIDWLLVDWLNDWLVKWFDEWLHNWMIVQFIVRFIGWLGGWLVPLFYSLIKWKNLNFNVLIHSFFPLDSTTHYQIYPPHPFIVPLHPSQSFHFCPQDQLESRKRKRQRKMKAEKVREKRIRDRGNTLRTRILTSNTNRTITLSGRTLRAMT